MTSTTLWTRVALLALLLSSSSALAAAPATFALIVTNNRSLDTGRPHLHYADDDGAKYAGLYSDFFGEAHVVLLTTMDPETRGLYPTWKRRALAPTRDNLRHAVDALATAGDAARLTGREVHVHVVLAGHGDVDRGQGFVELEDGRLTAAQLEEDVIGGLRADRVHLLLDSCNSWFMLSPRKPGGRRWATSTEGLGLQERHDHVGAMISTTAEAVTYEWSELQSGIFSYEVRSGLRGAADADGDGRITYTEMRAFVTEANAALVNDLYRPKVYARGPGGQEGAVLLDLTESRARRRLVLPEGPPRRITVRDPRGVRVADVHTEGGASVQLLLPEADATLGVYETITSGEGADRSTEVRYVELDDAVTTHLAAAPEEAPQVAGRGEAGVFRELFARPFGPEALARRVDEWAEDDEQIFGVTRSGLQRMDDFLDVMASESRSGRHFIGASLFAFGGGLAVGSISSAILQEQDWAYQTAIMGGTSALMFAGGITAFAMSGRSEDALEAYRAADMSDEAARAQALRQAEQTFEGLARRAKIFRIVNGSIMTGSGGVVIMSQLFTGMIVGDDHWKSPMFITGLTSGALSITMGIYTLVGLRTTEERFWDLYQARRGLDLGLPGGVTVGAPSMIVTDEGFAFSLSGSF